MAYCTFDDVRNIISTSLENSEITSLIIFADQEIADRLLTARGSVKLISMYFTASLIALREPRSRSAGGVSVDAPVTAREWREMAEDLIQRSGEPPIIVANDPLPDE